MGGAGGGAGGGGGARVGAWVLGWEARWAWGALLPRGGSGRLVDAEPRALITGGAAPLPLASDVIEASGTIPADDAERTVILSERFDGEWRATLDGHELVPVEIDGWAQGFLVPAGAEGELDVHREQPLLLLWQLLLYGAVALTALLAIPWRVRTRTVEEMYG